MSMVLEHYPELLREWRAISDATQVRNMSWSALDCIVLQHCRALSLEHLAAVSRSLVVPSSFGNIASMSVHDCTEPVA